MTHHKRNPIKRHGESPKSDFAILPNALIRDPDLSAAARVVAALMRSHADDFEISSVYLAENLRYGRDKIRKALAELTTARWLVIREYRNDEGKRIFSEYHLHSSRPFTVEEAAELSRSTVLVGKPTQDEPQEPEAFNSMVNDGPPPDWATGPEDPRKESPEPDVAVCLRCGGECGDKMQKGLCYGGQGRVSCFGLYLSEFASQGCKLDVEDWLTGQLEGVA